MTIPLPLFSKLFLPGQLTAHSLSCSGFKQTTIVHLLLCVFLFSRLCFELNSQFSPNPCPFTLEECSGSTDNFQYCSFILYNSSSHSDSLLFPTLPFPNYGTCWALQNIPSTIVHLILSSESFCLLQVHLVTLQSIMANEILMLKVGFP